MIISLAVAGGCDDDTCGVQGAPTDGLVASNAELSLDYGSLSSSVNNDCGFGSMTIFGAQSGAAGAGVITLCVPAPAMLNEPGRTIGLDQISGDIQIVDLKGTANNCTFKIDRTVPPTGTGNSNGLCDAGKSAAGFALVLDGGVTLTRTCGTTVDTVVVTLAGRVAVVAQTP